MRNCKKHNNSEKKKEKKKRGGGASYELFQKFQGRIKERINFILPV
jgi:hypothetical protein